MSARDIDGMAHPTVQVSLVRLQRLQQHLAELDARQRKLADEHRKVEALYDPKYKLYPMQQRNLDESLARYTEVVGELRHLRLFLFALGLPEGSP